VAERKSDWEGKGRGKNWEIGGEKRAKGRGGGKGRVEGGVG